MLLLTLVLSISPAGEVILGQAYFLGDLHSHTGASGDGGSADLGSCDTDCGAVADLGTYSREAGLDFVAVTDHVNGPATASAVAFGQVISSLLAEHDPEGGLVTIPGAEVWLRWPDGAALGHKDLLLFSEDAEALGAFRLEDAQPNGDTTLTVASCEDIGSWMSQVEADHGPALLLPHHPALSIPMETDWTCHEDRWSPAVEIYSKHGNSLVHPAEWDPPWSPTVPASTVHAALDLGLPMGFVGGTDTHDSRPGSVCQLDPEAPDHPYGGSLTVAVLPEGESLSRTSLYQAIVDHRTYVTTGRLVPVDMAWSSQDLPLGGHGARPQVPEGQDLDLVVRLTEEGDGSVVSARLVGPESTWDLTGGDGSGERRVSIPSEDLPAWLYLDLTLDPGQPEGCEDGGGDALEHVWTSPVWPVVVPPEAGHSGDSGGDSGTGQGVETAEGRCGGCSSPPVTGGPWVVFLLALWRRGPRRQAA